MAELPKLMAKAQIEARIKTIGENTDQLDKLVHETAIQAILHAAPKDVGGNGSGDVTLFARLVNVLGAARKKGKGYYVQGLIKWAYDHTPIREGDSNDNEMKFGLLKKGINRDYPADKPWDIEGLIKTPFWEYEPARQPRARPPLTADDILGNIIKLADRVETSVKDDKFAGGENAAQHVMNALAVAAKAFEEAMGQPVQADAIRDPRNEEHRSFVQVQPAGHA